MHHSLDGSRISLIIEAALTDDNLRRQLYYCPEVALRNLGIELNAKERIAIMTGDIAPFALEPEVLSAARRIFNEVPDSDHLSPQQASATWYSNVKEGTCI